MSLIILDTQLLLWSSFAERGLSAKARRLIEDPAHTVAFSVISIWEVAIKSGLRHLNFTVDPRVFRQGLLNAGYREISVLGGAAEAIADLPPIHKDPFDRMLVAQTHLENARLLTSDRILSRYSEAIVYVG